MSAAAAQMKLPYQSGSSYCALATLNGVRERLPGYDSDDVTAAIEQGFLVAWDIRAAKASARELRILPKSVDWFVPRAQNYRLNQAEHNPWRVTWKAVVLKGLMAAEWIGARTAAVILNCDAQHVTRLIDDGQLEQVGEYAVGRGNGAKIMKGSFVRFLERRLQ